MSHDSVRAVFASLSAKFEGQYRWPYLDVEGFVTVGIGCLIHPLPLALALQWRMLDGPIATTLQVTEEWEYLRQSHELARLGARAAEHATHLRLSDAQVANLLESRMAQNEAVLAKTFEGWAGYPGDAQLGIHSMAWAMGAGFAKGYPRFVKAALAGDWDTAAKECAIGGEDRNAGIVPRNVANRVCFGNAARVKENPAALVASETYWPLELRSDSQH